MKYIGVDLHNNFSQVFSLDKETGETIEKRVPNEFSDMCNFFSPLAGNCKVAVEATRNWYWFVDLLQSMNIDVVLSNPVQTKAISYARVKNDKVDAKMLSNLLENDLLPESYIPNREERKVREMLRMRMRMVKNRTMMKNIVRSSLAKLNIKLEHGDIWNGEGREELESLNLESPYQEIIDQSLEMIDITTNYISTWEKKLQEAIKDNKEVIDSCKLLGTHPGIGTLSALTILYESGPVTRFRSADIYTAYAGLVPKTKGSADKYRSGHLSKQANMYLKWIYVETAIHTMRMWKSPLRDFYQKKMWHRGKPIARIALARKIAVDAYYILKDRINYTTFLERGTKKEGRTSL